MSVIKSILARLYRDERGASLVEYSVLIGIITALAIGSIVIVSGKVQLAWSTLAGTAW